MIFDHGVKIMESLAKQNKQLHDENEMMRKFIKGIIAIDLRPGSERKILYQVQVNSVGIINRLPSQNREWGPGAKIDLPAQSEETTDD